MKVIRVGAVQMDSQSDKKVNLRKAGDLIGKFVPSEYTLYTGKDHWEPVLRTRAIENQCFIVAPAQIGIKPLFQTYGRSLIIDPWGTVLAKASDKETCVLAELDMEYLERVRQQVPSLKNRRPAAYQWPQ